MHTHLCNSVRRSRALHAIVAGVMVAACRPTPATTTTTTAPAPTTAVPAPAPAPPVQVEMPTIIGTWELVSTRLTRGDSVLLDLSAPAVRAFKIVNATHYSVISLRGDQFMRAGAGRYTLNGDHYVETIEIASGRFTAGREYAFTVMIDGDVWTTDGGTATEHFHEVWRRVR